MKIGSPEYEVAEEYLKHSNMRLKELASLIDESRYKAQAWQLWIELWLAWIQALQASPSKVLALAGAGFTVFMLALLSSFLGSKDKARGRDAPTSSSLSGSSDNALIAASVAAIALRTASRGSRGSSSSFSSTFFAGGERPAGGGFGAGRVGKVFFSGATFAGVGFWGWIRCRSGFFDGAGIGFGAGFTDQA